MRTPLEAGVSSIHTQQIPSAGIATIEFSIAVLHDVRPGYWALVGMHGTKCQYVDKVFVVRIRHVVSHPKYTVLNEEETRELQSANFYA